MLKDEVAVIEAIERDFEDRIHVAVVLENDLGREFSLDRMQGIVEIVGDHANGRKVKRVTLEVGKFAGVMSDAVLFCFDLAAQGTALEGAFLEIREIEARALLCLR